MLFRFRIIVAKLIEKRIRTEFLTRMKPRGKSLAGIGKVETFKEKPKNTTGCLLDVEYD